VGSLPGKDVLFSGLCPGADTADQQRVIYLRYNSSTARAVSLAQPTYHNLIYLIINNNKNNYFEKEVEMDRFFSALVVMKSVSGKKGPDPDQQHYLKE
jgi:hypothetical protein